MKTDINPQYVRRSRWFAAILALWLIAMFVSFDARFYSRAVLLEFAAGASWVKPLFVVAWALILSALVAVPIGAAPVRKSRIFFLLSGGLALPVIAHFWYCAKVGVSPLVRTISFIHRELSSNELDHIHAYKGMLWKILSAIGRTSIANSTDPGAVYASVLPGWFYFIGMILIPCIAWFAYRVLIQLLREWDSRRHAIFFPPFLICSGILGKAIVDGGPFDPQSLVAIPFFTALVLYSAAPMRRFLIFLFCGLLAAAIIDAFVFYLCYGEYWRGLPIFLSTYCCTAAAGLLAGALMAKGFRIRCFLLAALHIFTAAASLPQSWWYAEYTTTQTPVVPGDTLYMCAYFGEDMGIPPAAQEGILKYYKIPITAPGRLYDWYRRLGMSPGFFPFALAGHGCLPGSPFIRAGDLYVLSGNLRPETPLPEYLQSFTFQPCSAPEQCTFHFTAVERGCTPDELVEILVSHLDASGVAIGVLQVKHEGQPPPPWPEWLKPSHWFAGLR